MKSKGFSLAAAMVALWLADHGHAACAAWPGEPDPLPTPETADPLEARWLALRLEELSGLATSLESVDPLEAHRVWRHAACIAGDALAKRVADGLARTRPRVVHRVGIRPAARSDIPPRRSSLAPAFSVLERDAELSARDLVAEAPLEFDFGPVDRELELAAEMLGQARFQAAIDHVSLARARMVQLDPHPAVGTRRARLELVAAMAQVALGQDVEARASVERALRAEPDLELDPLLAPPRLQRLVEVARASLAERQP
jgi:hypothetical protein